MLDGNGVGAGSRLLYHGEPHHGGRGHGFSGALPGRGDHSISKKSNGRRRAEKREMREELYENRPTFRRWMMCLTKRNIITREKFCPA